MAWVLAWGVLAWGLSAAVVEAQPGEPWSRLLPSVRLERQLHATGFAERRAAAEALGRVGDAAQARAALLEALEGERDPRVRVAIADSLARRPGPEAFEPLVAAFDVARDLEARALARALAALGSVPARGVLVDALARDDLRVAAREALERVGVEAVPQLLRRLREDPDEVAAIELLGQAGDAQAVPLLTRLATSPIPAVRRAALASLVAIGDPRGRAVVLDALSDPEPGVQRIAVGALSRLGTEADGARLEERLAEARRGQRRQLLEALLRVAPARGAEAVVAEVTSDAAERVRVAGDLALAHPFARLTPVLYGMFREGGRRQEAAAALAEVEGGRGLGVLLREAEAPEASRELAVGLRRWESRVPSSLRERALTRLRALPAEGPGAPRAWVLRALARDEEIAGTLARALESEDGVARRAAAHALGLLGGERAREALWEALTVERDASVFRALAAALMELPPSRAARAGLGPPPPPSPAPLLAALEDPERAREAAALAATLPLEGRAARQRGRALRRLLRESEAADRTTAAWALGAAGEAAAWRALLERVERDEVTEVRRAAARALAVLGARLSTAQREAVAAAARAAEDDEVRRWLAQAAGGRSMPARVRGRQVLRFRVRAAGAPSGVAVDLAFPDGRVLRLHTLPSGELFLADLPDQVVDVRPRVAR
ncbi:MAG: hypothetical protein CMN29_04315 [Sandaracinus sp.]|nr:hypothetical protein [Sandaracinus sp.]